MADTDPYCSGDSDPDPNSAWSMNPMFKKALRGQVWCTDYYMVRSEFMVGTSTLIVVSIDFAKKMYPYRKLLKAFDVDTKA